MASTYSTALRLELMATGDQSGTWGDTTNTNLGTLIEQAITGYLSVAQGDVANLTLTTVNGGTDQARNAVVRITGALTATRNVVVQTAAKLYTIANDTTGGFSIVVKTSGGTGISIPPGAMIDCYSDGTNVVGGQNYWRGQIGGAVYLDAGATVGPVMDLFRDSTSPAASDILGQVLFNGRDSAGNKQEYASIQAVIADPTSTSEDSTLDFYVQTAGARVKGFSMGQGVFPFGVVRTQVFTGSGTYTPNANMVSCQVWALGGGGGGGAITFSGTGAWGGAGGGGAGALSFSVFSSATIGASQTVTIGAAGTGGSGSGTGGSGGTTSLGALITAPGGSGGGGSTGGSGSGGAGGVAGTAQVAGTGARGGGIGGGGSTSSNGVGGSGASSLLGTGGLGGVTFNNVQAGGAPTGYGAGGAGGSAQNSTTAAAGAAGAIGLLWIVEFCSA